MTTPTEKEIAALVDAVEVARQLHTKPLSVEHALAALQGIFAAQEPLRQTQKPRVGIMYEHADGVMTNPCKAIELIPAVKLALDEAGIEYNG